MHSGRSDPLSGTLSCYRRELRSWAAPTSHGHQMPFLLGGPRFCSIRGRPRISHSIFYWMNVQIKKWIYEMKTMVSLSFRLLWVLSEIVCEKNMSATSVSRRSAKAGIKYLVRVGTVPPWRGMHTEQERRAEKGLDQMMSQWRWGRRWGGWPL